MLHAPFLLRAGVVHVYKKVFVSTLKALPLRQDPLVVCHYHRQYLVISVLLVTHYRQTGITCGVLCSLFDEAEPVPTLEAKAAPSGFCVTLHS